MIAGKNIPFLLTAASREKDRGEPVIHGAGPGEILRGQGSAGQSESGSVPGENLVILGRSGTGKSVLIKCMVGMIHPDAGEVNVLGYDLSHLSAKELMEVRLQVGFSFRGVRCMTR